MSRARRFHPHAVVELMEEVWGEKGEAKAIELCALRTLGLANDRRTAGAPITDVTMLVLRTATNAEADRVVVEEPENAIERDGKKMRLRVVILHVATKAVVDPAMLADMRFAFSVADALSFFSGPAGLADLVAQQSLPNESAMLDAMRSAFAGLDNRIKISASRKQTGLFPELVTRFQENPDAQVGAGVFTVAKYGTTALTKKAWTATSKGSRLSCCKKSSPTDSESDKKTTGTNCRRKWNRCILFEDCCRDFVDGVRWHRNRRHTTRVAPLRNLNHNLHRRGGGGHRHRRSHPGGRWCVHVSFVQHSILDRHH
jgi:hypothetical protein